ncbi:hypothetical protein QCA50_009247 [Cerrena zonata]|uniref:Histone deacetylase domain-containing protein n=1 Tax=Cerrena zonata TaxID=2478898 RepID=A0AAW0G4S1_9APHY
MTVSFHKFNGEFFPGTGSTDEIGVGKGKNYAINVPLKDGIDDDSYIRLFKLIMEPLITKFQPTCIVQQCGADSLGFDRLGCFNLNIRGHEGRIDNKNSKKYLESVKLEILEQLRYLTHAPSVQMQEIPPDITGLTEEEEEIIKELNLENDDDETRKTQDMKDESRDSEMMD